MDVLVTGATGLLGVHLLRVLSKDADVSSIYALTRNKAQAQQTLNQYGIGQNKVVLIEGDIRFPSLGVREDELADLKKVREAYHLAAMISLSNNPEDAAMIHEVNVRGTANLLMVLRGCADLQKFFFVSSAYACGYYDGVVPECWMAQPKGFRNFYEESKFMAEKEIKKFFEDTDIACALIRPSLFLTQDHADFEKIKSQTTYCYCYIISKILREHALHLGQLRFLGNPHSTLNMVRVKDLVSLLIGLRRDLSSLEIINMVNANDIFVDDLLQSFKKGLPQNTELVFKTSLNIDHLNAIEQEAYHRTSVFSRYTLNQVLSWQTEKASKMKKELGIKDMTTKEIQRHFEEFDTLLQKKRQIHASRMT